MQTIYPQQAREASKSSRFALTSFGAALVLGLGTLAPVWAQDAPTAPAPVPGAGAAAAQATVSGSGATTGAGSDPVSATTMMKATGTTSTSSGSRASKNNKGKKKNADKLGFIEPWPGRRVLLLLPLQIGAGFNADRAFGQAILSRAEAELQTELEATGKFSVIRAHRFSPLLQRALQEKRVTADEAETVIEGPAPGAAADAVDDPITVQGATTFLQRFTFDQLPMIAQFSLEEVRSSSLQGRPGVQAQVSGRLYEQGNPVALKAPVLTSETIVKGRNNIDRYLEATRLAFAAVAGDFVAPLEDIVLPSAAITEVSSTPTQPAAPDTSMGTSNATEAPVPAAEPATPVPAPAAPAPDTAPPAVAPGTEPAQ